MACFNTRQKTLIKIICFVVFVLAIGAVQTALRTSTLSGGNNSPLTAEIRIFSRPRGLPTDNSKIRVVENRKDGNTTALVIRQQGTKESVARFGEFKCLKAQAAPQLVFPMCVYYPWQDFFISGPIWRSGELFEKGLVASMLEILNSLNNKQAGLIDVGANIGTYTLPVAHQGHPVVAVEPMADCVRRLRKSIVLGKLTNVHVIEASLSNEAGSAFLRVNKANPGGSYLVSIEDCFGWENEYYCDNSSEVPVKTLDALIEVVNFTTAVMKIDCEGLEWKVLQAAKTLFDKVDIIYVQMEWLWYTTDKLSISNENVEELIQFFTARQYSPFSPEGEMLCLSDWSNWPNDVIWKQSNVVSLGQV